MYKRGLLCSIAFLRCLAVPFLSNEPAASRLFCKKMSNHPVNEYVELQLTNDVPFRFKIEIYADELFVDKDDNCLISYTQVNNFHSIEYNYTVKGARPIKISGTNIFYINVSQLHITNLILSNCPQLEYLDCSGNQLSRLDLEKCEALEDLYCHSNRLTNLTIPHFSKINLLNLSDNCIEELQLGNCSYLQTLYCSQNRLHRLDLSGCVSINDINISYNSLKENTLTDIFRQLPPKNQDDFAMIHYPGNPGSETCEKSCLIAKNWR